MKYAEQKERIEPEAEKDISDFSRLSTDELEEALRKKREKERLISYFIDKGAYTEEDCKYIRDHFGTEPTYQIRLAPNDLPKDLPKSLEYLDEISKVRFEHEKNVIMKHFPEAIFAVVKELGTNRDVSVIVGVDPKLANGVLALEKEKVKATKELNAIKDELEKRGVQEKPDAQTTRPIQPRQDINNQPAKTFVERTRKTNEPTASQDQSLKSFVERIGTTKYKSSDIRTL